MLWRIGQGASLPVGGYTVNNLRYADDTTLIATSVADMAELLKRVKVESELLGLRLNVSKTKIMAVIGPDSVQELLIHCKNVGQTITQRWFNYEQPNFWVNNCQSWLKCWLITKLLDKIFDQLPNCWVTFHQQLVIIIYPTTGLFIVDPTLKYCPTF